MILFKSQNNLDINCIYKLLSTGKHTISSQFISDILKHIGKFNDMLFCDIIMYHALNKENINVFNAILADTNVYM
jgi:hypothetical protein